MFRLDQKVTIVTGSSRGIGEVIARTLADLGADVVVTYLECDDTEQDNAYRVAGEIGSDMVIGFDVRHFGSVSDLMLNVADRKRRIDILVNNAGINRVADFDKQTEMEWWEVLNVDLIGVWRCMVEAINHMPDGGRIVNIGSVSGQYGGPRTPSYAAAKGGVEQLTRNGCINLGKRGITVNCVAPGMIDSGMLDNTMSESMRIDLMGKVPLARLGTKEEVAATVAFLCSDEAGYISGQTIGVNGGLWF